MPVCHHAYARMRQPNHRRPPRLGIADEAEKVFTPCALGEIAVIEDKRASIAFHVSLRVELYENRIPGEVYGLKRLEKRPNVKPAVLA